MRPGAPPPRERLGAGGGPPGWSSLSHAAPKSFFFRAGKGLRLAETEGRPRQAIDLGAENWALSEENDCFRGPGGRKTEALASMGTPKGKPSGPRPAPTSKVFGRAPAARGNLLGGKTGLCGNRGKDFKKGPWEFRFRGPGFMPESKGSRWLAPNRSRRRKVLAPGEPKGKLAPGLFRFGDPTLGPGGEAAGGRVFWGFFPMRHGGGGGALLAGRGFLKSP